MGGMRLRHMILGLAALSGAGAIAATAVRRPAASVDRSRLLHAASEPGN